MLAPDELPLEGTRNDDEKTASGYRLSAMEGFGLRLLGVDIMGLISDFRRQVNGWS
jgi:hypothetical protein